MWNIVLFTIKYFKEKRGGDFNSTIIYFTKSLYGPYSAW